MSRITHLKTREEFLDWAFKQDAKSKFTLGDQYSGHNEPCFQLNEAGTGNRWNSMNCTHIPMEVGLELADAWKTNQYNRFVGIRPMKSILGIISQDDDLVDDYEAAVEIRKVHEANRSRRIAAQNAMEVGERMLEDLVKFDKYLEDADLKGAITGDVVILGLEDVMYVLEGFMEATNVVSRGGGN